MALSVAKLLLLIVVANGAPILVAWLCRGRLARPVDGGRRGRDGAPLLGPSKTWRGLAAAVLAGGLVAPLLGLSAALGALIAAAAMAGDLLSSYLKRRLGMQSSARAPGLDQVPESLLPALVATPALGLSLTDVLTTVTGFFMLELLLSRLLYRWGLRRRPY